MIDANKIKELIAKQLNKPVAEITDDKELIKDLGADSLDVVEMLMDMDEQFGIKVSDEEAVNIKTIGDILNLLNNK